MPPEPAIKRTAAFVDGQNLFFAARQAFGYTYPNYDVPALAASVCTANGWQLDQARFYTGIPDDSDDPFWNYFWGGKLRKLSRQGVEVFSRSLRYRNKTVKGTVKLTIATTCGRRAASSAVSSHTPVTAFQVMNARVRRNC